MIQTRLELSLELDKILLCKPPESCNEHVIHKQTLYNDI